MSVFIGLVILFCACFVRPVDEAFEAVITKNEELDAMLNDLEKKQRELIGKLK